MQYLALRIGDYLDHADEGGDRSYPFATIAGGVEYACRCGFTAWAEAGPAAVSYMAAGPRSLSLGIYASAGVGYRIRTR
jgi:hypothetical protein